jgi:hypothetical protein
MVVLIYQFSEEGVACLRSTDTGDVRYSGKNVIRSRRDVLRLEGSINISINIRPFVVRHWFRKIFYLHLQGVVSK